MFDEKTILARLQNGEDAQKIADEMAAMMNKANKTYTEQKAAEEAAKHTNFQKKEEMQDILDSFHIWLSTYYKIDRLDEMFEELTADSVIELIEALEEYAKAMSSLKSMFDVKTVAVKLAYKKPKVNADAKIDAFLKEMGW